MDKVGLKKFNVVKSEKKMERYNLDKQYNSNDAN